MPFLRLEDVVSSTFRFTVLASLAIALAGVDVTSAAKAGASFINQLQHTAWSISDGAPPDVWSIAQTSDGYLWLGTGDGLYRFDGVRFERIVPAAGKFPHTDIVALLVTDNDDLLIGYQNGGVSLLTKKGLTNFREFPAATLNKIVKDGEDHIWALSYTTFRWGGLLRLADGKWVRSTSGLPPDIGATDMAVDPSGRLWLLVGDRFYYLPAGQQRFVQSDLSVDGEGRLAFSANSGLWFATQSSVRHLPAIPRGSAPARRPSDQGRILFSNGGDLWSVNPGSGIMRLTEPGKVPVGSSVDRTEADVFGRKNGLTSNIVGTIFEDRENNIWIGTNMGIDRFRAADVVPERAINPTSRTGYRLAPAGGGAFYVVQDRQLYLLAADGALTRLDGTRILQEAFCPGQGNSLWVASARGFSRWSGHKSEPAALPPGVEPEQINSCQEDGAGRLWLSVSGQGIFRRDPRGWNSLPEFAKPAADGPAMLASDHGGGMWIYFLGKSLQLMEAGRIRSFGEAEGLDVGGIEIVYSDANGTLVGGDFGLARLDGRRFRTIRSDLSEPFRRIAGIAETRDGMTWLNTLSGVIRVDAKELRDAFRRGRWPARYRLFDRRDGLPGLAQQDSYTQTAVEGPDGRLWFITNQGIAWIDPHRLLANPLPPPVIIQGIVAQGRTYTAHPGLVLPASARSIQISYTAPSLRVPERVAFRYMLEGVDKGWIDPGRRRQAFYTQLGPGDYVFRVVAANDAGVWNRDGAALHFTIRPTFTETRTFLIACILAVLAVLVAIYRTHLRRVSMRLRERLEERLRERERIARELHDTLLQGFQGLQLHFQSAIDKIPAESPARTIFERTLTLADGVLADARDRVRDLRSSGTAAGLPRHLRLKGERMIGDRPILLKIEELGDSRELDAAVEREVAAIAEEAMFNAVRHAGGSLIEVRISHSKRRLTLMVSDNGKGISETVARGGVDGHFGLLGMRERARRMRGKIAIQTGTDGGTEVRLTVPARVAYGGLLGFFDQMRARSSQRGRSPPAAGEEAGLSGIGGQ